MLYYINYSCGCGDNEEIISANSRDSADIYAALKEGETYEVTVVGFRVPFLSMYENIISYKEVE